VTEFSPSGALRGAQFLKSGDTEGRSFGRCVSTDPKTARQALSSSTFTPVEDPSFGLPLHGML